MIFQNVAVTDVVFVPLMEINSKNPNVNDKQSDPPPKWEIRVEYRI